jgi:hypothetical protein
MHPTNTFALLIITVSLTLAAIHPHLYLREDHQIGTGEIIRRDIDLKEVDLKSVTERINRLAKPYTKFGEFARMRMAGLTAIYETHMLQMKI